MEDAPQNPVIKNIKSDILNGFPQRRNDEGGFKVCILNFQLNINFDILDSNLTLSLCYNFPFNSKYIHLLQYGSSRGAPKAHHQMQDRKEMS